MKRNKGIFIIVIVLIITIIISINKMTNVFADEDQYPHLCKNINFLETINKELIEQENGYQIIKINNINYIYINSCLDVPKNKCKDNELVLFKQ